MDIIISSFKVYTGKKGNAVEKNVGSRVVKTLSRAMGTTMSM